MTVEPMLEKVSAIGAVLNDEAALLKVLTTGLDPYPVVSTVG